MKIFFVFSGFAIAATLLGCGNNSASRQPTLLERTQILEREKNEYQRACQDRDEQLRVIEELEKLDRALPAAEQKKALAEIEQLEVLRQQLNEDVKQEAVRVADAKQALDEQILTNK